jgi:hypothetical protein
VLLAYSEKRLFVAFRAWDPDPSRIAAHLSDRDAIGMFVAQDEVTNLQFPGSQGSSSGSLEESNTAAVFRYRRDIGSDSTIGVLLTGRESGGYYTTTSPASTAT